MVDDQRVFVEWVNISVEIMITSTVNDLTSRAAALYKARFICGVLLSTQIIL